MRVLRSWVRMPAPWVEGHGLKHLKWTPGQGANNTAALMVFVVIAQHGDQESNVSRITYDDLCIATGLSRAKVSAGLRVLKHEGLIEFNVEGRSTYKLTGCEDGVRWGKLPARAMYSGKSISAFRHFKLRNQCELNAMKLFLLFVVRRDSKENVVMISYDKITEYTDIDRPRIAAAVPFLTSLGLIRMERFNSLDGNGALYNAYRLSHVDPYNHPAAQARS